MNDLKGRIIGIPIITALIVLFYNGNTNCFIPDFWIDVLVTFIYTTIIWHGNRACFILIKNKFNSIHQTRIRLIYLSLIVVLFSTVASIVLDIIFKYFVFAVPVNVPDLGTNIILSIGFSLVVMLIYESAYFFTMWKQAIIAAEELKKVNIQAQFNALKMRVSPHFLFNSLNTLSALIEEDKQQSIRFVQELSNVYRHLLQRNDNRTTTLGDELKFIHSYFYLLKTRFGNSLQMHIDVLPSTLPLLLPPLTLQLLIENAVKHNVISTSKPLQITISQRGSQLIVANNLQPKVQVVNTDGFGLKNINQQYKLLGYPPIDVQQVQGVFSVALPLISTK